jgi:hypothetical protein
MVVTVETHSLFPYLTKFFHNFLPSLQKRWWEVPLSVFSQNPLSRVTMLFGSIRVSSASDKGVVKWTGGSTWTKVVTFPQSASQSTERAATWEHNGTSGIIDVQSQLKKQTELWLHEYAAADGGRRSCHLLILAYSSLQNTSRLSASYPDLTAMRSTWGAVNCWIFALTFWCLIDTVFAVQSYLIMPWFQ